MDKCEKYLKLLSAYVDGEVSESEKHQMENHLDICKHCSALLEAYRQIAIAVDESTVPAPNGLLSGVMHAVNSSAGIMPSADIISDIKKNAKRRIMLTRYMPVAACLVAALLIWGLLGDPYRPRYDPAGGSAPQSSMDEAIHAEPEAYGAQDASSASYEDADQNAILSGGSINGSHGLDELPEESGSAQDQDVQPAPNTEQAPMTAQEDAITRDGTATENINKAVSVKITADEAMQIMEESEQYILLDVRTESEYMQQRISGALLIPHTDIAASASDSLPDKDAIILVYCQTGGRSAAASKMLASMGYTRVYDIGGIADWPYETVK